MDKEQALHAFFSSFTWPAYDENTVPTDAQMPYITYEAAFDRMGHTVYLSASLYQRSSSWAGVTAKSQEVAALLGRSGLNIPFDYGGLRIAQGSPFATRLPDDDDGVRRIRLNFNVEYITDK